MLAPRRPERPDAEPFLDTPMGIVTPEGTYFQTTRALLERYAGGVLEHVSLATLIARAEVWLRSGQTAALWVLAPLLLVLPPLWATVIALLIYLAWETLSPVVVSRRIVAVFRVLEQPVVQAVLYVAVLSALGVRGQMAAVATGLLFFVAMRWRMLPWGLRPLVEALRRPLTTLPAPDQILRAFVLRAALRHRVALPQLDALKQELRARK